MSKLTHEDMSRILVDHQWSSGDDWAFAIRQLADLADHEVEALDRGVTDVDGRFDPIL